MQWNIGQKVSQVMRQNTGPSFNLRLSSLESAWLVLKPKLIALFDMEFLWPKAVAGMLEFHK